MLAPSFLLDRAYPAEGDADAVSVGTEAEAIVKEIITGCFISKGSFAAAGHKRTFNSFLRCSARNYPEPFIVSE